MSAARFPGKTLIPAKKIQARVRALGREISQHYGDRPLTVVGLMNGSLFFLVDLLRHLPPQTRIECWRVSSYEGKKSTGRLRGLDAVQGDYRGRHVLVVDDILDTGLTFRAVRAKLLALRAADVRFCVLLDKRIPRPKAVSADWVGFPIGNEFVLGYGLDLDHAYRTLPMIRAVPPAE
ncbi:MAG: phosphoribosyltransferase family protein [Candidatus Methylacidiphilales bacterium]|nr:phosphoribosyltransferase family protein [Candidatus Methylacidiphilales bacterium]